MSENECRNNCTTPLRFPRRPGTNFFVGAGDECICCESDTKISADNRPSLRHFNYRIGTYASIREFLFHRINHTPNLQNWTHREPDDPAIALLEGASILGDILTFYQETYANEAFLRTAEWRESILDLVRLTGYRLSPALGGNATFAFEIKKDEPVSIPSGFPLKATLEELEKPAEFETTEEITAYPWLSRFNLFRPLVQNNITASTTEFYIYLPNQSLEAIALKPGDRLMIGESDATGTDQPAKLTNPEIVIIDSIREQHGTKIFKIKGKLKRSGIVGSLVAYKLGRTFHHFGYNSPTEFVEPPAKFSSTTSTDGKTVTTSINIQNVPDSRKIDATTIDDLIDPNLSSKDFPLDAEVQDLASNVNFIVQGFFSKRIESKNATANLQNKTIGGSASLTIEATTSLKLIDETSAGFSKTETSKFNKQKALIITSVAMTLVRTADEIKTEFIKWGSLSATTSVLHFSESLSSSTDDKNQLKIRNALFHEAISPLFVIKKVKIETTNATGNSLNFYGTARQVENLLNRRIMLEKVDAEPFILTVMSVPVLFELETIGFPKLRQITVSDQVDYADFPNENPLVTVFGNIADADQGKTVPEAVIGSGDNTKVFQTFKLPKSPLTYHIETLNTPPETPELDIYVSGRLWQKVETLFGRKPQETIYIVREDAENNSWVQFGDGKTGAKLPTGIKNLTAVERIGNGAFGALKPDTKVQAGAKIKNLDKIQMPLVASGGSDVESGENARQAAPAKVQSLGRIVSLRDYEAEAAAISGVAVANAAWQTVENIPAIVITVLTETGRSGELAAIEETLNGYNIGRGANRFSIFVTPGKRMFVRVSVEYALDATFRSDLVEPEIRRALGVNFGKASNNEDQSGLFSLRQRRFGAREYASSIEGVVQNVMGVIWARTTCFDALSDTDKPNEIELPTNTVLNQIVAAGATHILSLFNQHLTLTQVSGE